MDDTLICIDAASSVVGDRRQISKFYRLVHFAYFENGRRPIECKTIERTDSSEQELT